MTKMLPCRVCGAPVQVSEKFPQAQKATCFDCAKKAHEAKPDTRSGSALGQLLSLLTSDKRSLLIVLLAAGLLVVPELAAPALAGAIAGMFASYLDNEKKP